MSGKCQKFSVWGDSAVHCNKTSLVHFAPSMMSWGRVEKK